MSLSEVLMLTALRVLSCGADVKAQSTRYQQLQRSQTWWKSWCGSSGWNPDFLVCKWDLEQDNHLCCVLRWISHMCTKITFSQACNAFCRVVQTQNLIDSTRFGRYIKQLSFIETPASNAFETMPIRQRDHDQISPRNPETQPSINLIRDWATRDLQLYCCKADHGPNEKGCGLTCARNAYFSCIWTKRCADPLSFTSRQSRDICSAHHPASFTCKTVTMDVLRTAFSCHPGLLKVFPSYTSWPLADFRGQMMAHVIPTFLCQFFMETCAWIPPTPPRWGKRLQPPGWGLWRYRVPVWGYWRRRKWRGWRSSSCMTDRGCFRDDEGWIFRGQLGGKRYTLICLLVF